MLHAHKTELIHFLEHPVNSNSTVNGKLKYHVGSRLTHDQVF